MLVNYGNEGENDGDKEEKDEIESLHFLRVPLHVPASLVETATCS